MDPAAASAAAAAQIVANPAAQHPAGPANIALPAAVPPAIITLPGG